MKKAAAFIITICLVFVAACDSGGHPPAQKNAQAVKAKKAANSVEFAGNAEIDNIKRRLELTSKPGLLGYITLLNSAGQPILYTGVRGKVSSGTKRLTSTQKLEPASCGRYCRETVMQAPGDEGTFGNSSPYIFFWDTNGKYHQWSGDYLYTTEPQRLRVEPLVVQHVPQAAEPAAP